MELKVDMLVRTSAVIGKILEIQSYGTHNILIEYCHGLMNITKDSIIKSSFNIIELIEVGDIVKLLTCKLHFVDQIYVFPNGDKTISFGGTYGTIISKSDIIKEVLTREQYEQNCYRTGEKELL